MKISVSNFKGIRTANVLVEKLTLVCSKNFQGKTSLYEATRYALTGELDYFKKEGDQLLRDGEKSGGIKITTNSGNIVVGLPSLKIESAGEFPPQMTNVDITDMPIKERKEWLSNVLNVLPTQEEIVNGLDGIGKYSPEKLKTTSDWDTEYNRIKDEGSKMKGRWEYITGERYGTIKADSYCPAGFDTNINPDDLAEQLELDRQEFSKLSKMAAVNESEIERLKEIVETKAGVDKRYSDMMKTVNKLSEALQKSRKDVDNFPLLEQKGFPCPVCKTLLNFTNNEMRQIKTYSTEEIEKNHAEYDKLTAILESAKAEHEKISVEFANAKNEATEYATAKRKLEQITNAKSSDNYDVVQNRISEREQMLENHRKYTEAHQTNNQIRDYIKLAKLLAPDGLRAQKLAKTIYATNTELAELSKISWNVPVQFNSDMEIVYGSRLYRYCSKSEKYRAQIILNVYFSNKTRSDVILIDEADILDSAGRNGLIKLLLNSNIPAMVFMTLPEKCDMPIVGITKFGGKCYWIEEGVTE